MDKTLVIMAAGIGSRYGAGVKQLAKMTSNDETIIDFSVFDAIKAGFNKVVFIIRKDIEKDFKEVIGDRISRYVDVEYAFQELEHIPEGLQVPEGRKKPWGTVHALLAAKNSIKSPFLVINADDYYGKDAFWKMSSYLDEAEKGFDRHSMAMCGYRLKNTLSDNGTVTRGLCQVDRDDYLIKIIETRGIKREDGKLVSDLDLSEDILNEEAVVSMNTWAGFPELMDYVQESFENYMMDNKDNLDYCEYVLPTMVDELISRDKAKIKVLYTNDEWIGITYKEDLEHAREKFREMISKGIYLDGLWV